jgi:hypothetical protein
VQAFDIIIIKHIDDLARYRVVLVKLQDFANRQFSADFKMAAKVVDWRARTKWGFQKKLKVIIALIGNLFFT